MGLKQEDYSKFIIRRDRSNEVAKSLRDKLGYSIIIDTHNDDSSEVFYIINLPLTPVRSGFKTYFKVTPECNMRSVNAKIKSVIKKSDEMDYTLGWQISSKPKIRRDKLRVSLGYETNVYRIKVFFV